MLDEERLRKIEQGQPVEDQYKEQKIKESRCKNLASIMFHDSVNVDVTKRRLHILMQMNEEELSALEKLYDIYPQKNEVCTSHQK